MIRHTSNSDNDQTIYIKSRMGEDFIKSKDLSFINNKLKIDTKYNNISLGGILNLIQIIAVIGFTLIVVIFFRRDLRLLRFAGFAQTAPYLFMSISNFIYIALILKTNISRKIHMRNILVLYMVFMIIVKFISLYLGLLEIDFSFVSLFLLILFYLKSRRVRYTFIE